MAKDVLDSLDDVLVSQDARMKLAELIAADVEYDEAWKAMCYDQGSGTENRFAEAKKRRAADLAACRGLA